MSTDYLHTHTDVHDMPHQHYIGSPAHRLTGSPAHRPTGSPPVHQLTSSQAHRLTGSPVHRLTGECCGSGGRRPQGDLRHFVFLLIQRSLMYMYTYIYIYLYVYMMGTVVSDQCAHFLFVFPPRASPLTSLCIYVYTAIPIDMRVWDNPLTHEDTPSAGYTNSPP